MDGGVMVEKVNTRNTQIHEQHQKKRTRNTRGDYEQSGCCTHSG